MSAMIEFCKAMGMKQDTKSRYRIMWVKNGHAIVEKVCNKSRVVGCYIDGKLTVVK